MSPLPHWYSNMKAQSLPFDQGHIEFWSREKMEVTHFLASFIYKKTQTISSGHHSGEPWDSE